MIWVVSPCLPSIKEGADWPELSLLGDSSRNLEQVDGGAEELVREADDLASKCLGGQLYRVHADMFRSGSWLIPIEIPLTDEGAKLFVESFERDALGHVRMQTRTQYALETRESRRTRFRNWQDVEGES